MKTKPTAAKTASLNPMTKNSDTEAIREFLVNRGVQAFQVQAGYLPSVTGVALPITEAQFSERQKATRKTRAIRTILWINRINCDWFSQIQLLGLGELEQINFICYEKYKEDGLE